MVPAGRVPEGPPFAEFLVIPHLFFPLPIPSNIDSCSSVRIPILIKNCKDHFATLSLEVFLIGGSGARDLLRPHHPIQNRMMCSKMVGVLIQDESKCDIGLTDDSVSGG